MLIQIPLNNEIISPLKTVYNQNYGTGSPHRITSTQIKYDCIPIILYCNSQSSIVKCHHCL